MRRACIFIITAILLASFSIARAENSLLLGPGDLVQVKVFDSPDLDEHSRINDAGELELVLGGNVKIAGLSPAEAGHVIEKALRDRNILLAPRVLVTVEEYVTEQVSVVGEVHKPGMYDLRTPRSVLDVLALAGGLTDVADRHIVVQRRGTSSQVDYFVSNTPATALATEVKVNPGDTVVVPKAHIVYVLGDVRIPGGYTMSNNESQLSVLQLVARAGGTNNTAVPSHARLIRKANGAYVESPLPLSAMQKGKHADVPLQADDIVYVPFSYLRNFYVGGPGIISAIGGAALYHF